MSKKGWGFKRRDMRKNNKWSCKECGSGEFERFRGKRRLVLTRFNYVRTEWNILGVWNVQLG